MRRDGAWARRGFPCTCCGSGTLSGRIASGRSTGEGFAARGRGADQLIPRRRSNQAFENDRTEVFEKFIEGLGAVIDQGGNYYEVLEELGLQQEEVNKTIVPLASKL